MAQTQYSDKAIVLSRVNYGERDKILTLLCQDNGKVSVLAKSVRAEKSRLAGGIELLSESEVNFIDSKSTLKTLTGARLKSHFGSIACDINLMNQAFSFIKTVNGISDERAGQEYYPVLLNVLSALNDNKYDPRIVEIWFCLQVLGLAGSDPNLNIEQESSNFKFDYDKQQFEPDNKGLFTKNDLKLLRLCATKNHPPKLQAELGSEDRLLTMCRTLLKTNLTEV